MIPGNDEKNFTRRGFFRGAGLLGLGGAAAALAGSQTGQQAQPETEPAVGMDLGRFGIIDPKLVGYKEVGRITSAHPEPKRVIVGPENQLGVVAGKHFSIYSKGAVELSIEGDAEIHCAALAGNGLIYVGSKEGIEVYNRQGKRIGAWEPKFEKAWFTSMAVGDNDLFVADAGNKIVHRFDRSGKVVGRIGDKVIQREGESYHGFAVPSPYFDLEIGRDGFLWVANPGNHRVEAFSFDGHMETSWGVASFGMGGFSGCCNPCYFTRLADGRFVTSEKGLGRVKVNSAKGEFETVVAGPNSFPKYLQRVSSMPVALDVAADSQGKVYVADSLGGEVRVFERA
jgi:hypothetical protein